jgi:CubicO group peptidase (beta-lactamase class C family)
MRRSTLLLPWCLALTIMLPAKGPVAGEAAIAPQAARPGGGREVSGDPYDHGKIGELKRKIAQGDFKDITSVVVIKDGKLLIEEYFNGADRTTLHNTRSVGKTFASALMGAAIRDGHIKSLDRTLGEFYGLKSFANYSAKKSAVRLKDLLTMSSAFLGSDDAAASPGNEEKMYPTPNWVRFALDLPMDTAKENGKQWDYFTAGIVVLGDILDRAVPGGLERYADRVLFEPLGITRYQWQYTPLCRSRTGWLLLRAPVLEHDLPRRRPAVRDLLLYGERRQQDLRVPGPAPGRRRHRHRLRQALHALPSRRDDGAAHPARGRQVGPSESVPPSGPA